MAVATLPPELRLSHLKQLEAEAIHIIPAQAKTGRKKNSPRPDCGCAPFSAGGMNFRRTVV